MSKRNTKRADLERNMQKNFDYARMYGKNVSLEEMKAHYRAEIAKKRQNRVITVKNPYLGPKDDENDPKSAGDRALERYQTYGIPTKPKADPNTAFLAKKRKKTVNELKELAEDSLPWEDEEWDDEWVEET